MPPGVGRNDRDICAERAFTIIKNRAGDPPALFWILCFGLNSEFGADLLRNGVLVYHNGQGFVLHERTREVVVTVVGRTYVPRVLYLEEGIALLIDGRTHDYHAVVVRSFVVVESDLAHLLRDLLLLDGFVELVERLVLLLLGEFAPLLGFGSLHAFEVGFISASSAQSGKSGRASAYRTLTDSLAE